MRRQPNNEPPWVLLSTTSTTWEAELLRGYLIANGVDAVVVSQVDTMRGLTLGLLAVAKIYVPAPQLSCAEKLLAAYQMNPPTPEDESSSP